MARQNIEDQFWLDAMAVASTRGVDVDKLAGNALRFQRYAQEMFKRGKLVSREEFDALGFMSELFPLFAREVEGGVQATGAEKHFSWLMSKSECGSIGGSVSSDAKRIAAQNREAAKAAARLSTSTTSKLEEAQASTSETEKPQASYSSSLSMNEEEEAEPKKNSKRNEVFKPDTVTDLLAGMSAKKLATWAELYPDEEFRIREVTKAISYYRDDKPQDMPRTRAGWSRALSYWFEKGWKHHRAANRIHDVPVSRTKKESGSQWDTEAGIIFSAVKKLSPMASDDQKAAFFGADRWEWVSRSGLIAKARSLPDNEWTRKQLAREAREAFERFQAQLQQAEVAT